MGIISTDRLEYYLGMGASPLKALKTILFIQAIEIRVQYFEAYRLQEHEPIRVANWMIKE